MQEIRNIVEKMSPISLDEMEKVALQNRMDTKFVFNSNKLPSILEGLSHEYRILEINDSRIMHYENYYFDDAANSNYHAHHNSHLNRYKVRSRHYVDTGVVYFELKFKSNKKRTIKKRVKVKSFKPKLTGKAKKLIRKNTHFDPSVFKPKLYVSFRRITLVHLKSAERATIDFNLKASSLQREHRFLNVAIAELKQERYSRRSLFYKALRAVKVREMRVSKYCMGMYNTFPGIKVNRFKRKDRKINKIAHGAML